MVDIIDENDIDIGVFAEYHQSNMQSISSMLNGKYRVVEGLGGCDKVIIIAKSSYDIEVRREQNRYIVYSVQYENEQYIIAGVHLQDNLTSDSDARKVVVRDLVSDIREQEKILKHNNTILIGDFNCSPFDSEMIQKDAFNAVLFRDLIMKQETVTFDHRKYQRFYNPMLNYISEDDSNYGSLYYASGLKTLYWYCYDQILMRKALVNRLLDVSYRKSIKGRKLLNEISPNKNISDHLPLIVKFERRTNDE